MNLAGITDHAAITNCAGIDKTKPSSIGARLPRLEDRALLTGRGHYVDDIVVPGMVHAAFLRSPHPHALIRGIETKAACALPGVFAVLSFDDLVPVMAKRRMQRRSNSGTDLERCWPFALADGEVSYVGEPVAVVLARTRPIAEDAALIVQVDYEPVAAAVDPRQAALAGAAPVRREFASNVVSTYRVGFGNIEAAFRTAAHVFREDYSLHRGAAHSIEGRGLVVEYRRQDDSLVVFASTQKPHDLFNSLASVLGLDENRLRVATPDIGGGFGPKLCVYAEDVAVVAAAKLTGRSVKWIEDRREHFLNAVQERDQYWSIEIAVDAEGRVLGLRGQLLHDLGAYALQDVNLPYNSASTLTGPYAVPALAMDVTVTVTNKVPVSSVRGAGYPQAAFVMERLLDRVARELDLDRAELRRRNLIPAAKMPYTKPLKTRAGAPVVYDSGDYPACQAAIVAAIDWNGFPARQEKALQHGRYIGIGLAHAMKGTGRGPFESGLVRISPTGRISVLTGAASLGQGLKTALAQICAAELGVAPATVEVVSGDTAMVPLGLGAFASRQLVTAGSSVLIAARAVAQKAKRLASQLLEVAEDDLELANGALHVVGAPALGVSLGELSRILQGAPGYGFPPGMEPGLQETRHFRTDALAYANACHAAEVEVDIETGEVLVLRYVAMQDSGTLINPLIVDGQVHGGIAHGIGNAVLENMVYDDAGQPLTMSFAEYLLPTAPDLPSFETLYQQTPSPLNPLGAKGAGEVGTIPAAAVIISAIENALRPFGVRLTRAPVTPADLVALIRRPPP
jgi:aerobic carbon-monoxide dehydrogenase large subunit